MDWISDYRRKVVGLEDAVGVVKSDDRVFMQAGCGVPKALEAALLRRAPELREVEICHLHSEGSAEYCQPRYEGHFRHNALFVAGNTRAAVNCGRADFTPAWLSDIPGLLRGGQLPVDVAMIHLSPPDNHGFCSFGVSVDISKPAAECARLVVAQVNDRMPRTLGDSFIHVSELDRVVEVSEPLPNGHSSESSERNLQIGRHVAGLIEDGSTLQMGIGGIPDAVLRWLMDRKELGVHTELFSDGVMELVEAGAVTNGRKTLHRGKVVASFIMGSQRLYDFIDNNPMIEMHPCDYTNDPFVIRQNDRMVAINSALQVDLTGQVCADSIGCQVYSGAGGQVDFMTGAARSAEGKPIIALPSTAAGGRVSRIVPTLSQGAGVVTSRYLVQYVVTEYGVAYLKGKSLRERAEALISVAHPDFRDELERACRALRAAA